MSFTLSLTAGLPDIAYYVLFAQHKNGNGIVALQIKWSLLNLSKIVDGDETL